MIRRVALLAPLAGIALVMSGCGSSGPAAAPATTGPPASTCALTAQAAGALIGEGAAETTPAPLGDGVPAPLSRCEYRAEGSALQYTAFAGSSMLAQLTTLLGDAQPAPEIGPGAYCSTYQRQATATIGCVFLNGSNTIALSLNVPSSELSDTTQAAMKYLATNIAGTPLDD